MGPLTAEPEETARTANAPAKARVRFAMPAEDLAWLSVIAGAIVLTAAFVWLAPPLAKLYPSPIRDEFPVWRMLIDPEPLEDVRSLMALATPILLAAVVLAFGSRQTPGRTLDPIVLAAQILGIGLLVWAVLEQPQTGPLLAADYFDRYLLSIPNLIAGVVIGVALTIALVRPSRRWLPDAGRSVLQWLTGSRWIPIAIAVAATAVWTLPAVQTTDTLSQSGFLAPGHIPGQGEDYFAVVNGRTPLVNYIAQYANLLPLMLAPLLKAVGPSITSYSITMCVLSGIGMLAILGAFAEVTRRLWIALALYLPWVALSLFPWHDIGSHREFNGIYYAVFPGRYFGPFVLAWLSALSMRGRRIPVWALFGFAGLTLLNNYEFGIGALLALSVALGVSWDRSVALRTRLGTLLIQGTAGLLGAFAVVCAITLVRTGELPSLSLLTYFNRLFLQESYGLQPMSSLGFHWVLFATYTGALLTAAVRYVRHEPDRVLTGMLAFSGIFGLVTGMYFVGRSSQYQLMLLFPAWGFSLAFVAWTAIGSLRAAGSDRPRLQRLLLPGLAALIGFGWMISSIDRLPMPQRQINRLRAGGPSTDLGPVERFIESRTHPGEHVLIIRAPGGADHLIAEQASVENVSPLNGVTSLISPAEADRSLDQLEADGGDQVFDGVSGLPEGGLIFGIPAFATLLTERGYRIVGQLPGNYLRLWRRAAS